MSDLHNYASALNFAVKVKVLCTAVCSKLQHWFINFYSGCLSYLDHPCLLAVAPTVKGIVILIINTLQFLLSTPHSTSQSNTLAIGLLLMFPRFGMTFLIMCTVHHLLHPSGTSLKLICLQKPFCHSLSVTPVSSLVRPSYVIWTYDYSHCFCSAEPLSLSNVGD